MAIRPRPRYALHLLWTVPLAGALGLLPLFFGGIALCGVSGCGGGGFGPAYGPDWEWIVPWCIVGLLLGLAVALVPWARLAARLGVGIVVALLVAGALVAYGIDAKYPLIR